MSSQDLNVSQPMSEQLLNNSEQERSELFPERGCRSFNSCERERVNHQQPANAMKHNNQEVSNEHTSPFNEKLVN